jgi:hypothetical protein
MDMAGNGSVNVRQGPPVVGAPGALELPEIPQTIIAPGSVTIETFEDGSIEIDEIGPLINGTGTQDADHFNANLAGSGGGGQDIAEDLLQGIEADERSRADFTANLTKGYELLGLKIEDATNSRGSKGSISNVNHPLLLESIVLFQSRARAEMMPAEGPCKVQTIGGSTQLTDELANSLEADMNNYLTNIDKGYYPDFDRGLFSLAYSGNLFKKISKDPIRRIPVSRSIGVEDLIVSEDAADLENALRVTHRAMMAPYQVRRLMNAGMFLEIDLPPATSMALSPVTQKQDSVIGVTTTGVRPFEQERTIFECYTDLDPVLDVGKREKGADYDQLLPYKVTLDKDTRRILEIRRNWKQDDPLFLKRQRFVHYGLIPSFNFLCLGYLHLLGNQTRALRAIWRILVDAGMFANFPGGVKAKGVRTDTNEIQPGPGEWPDVDIGPFDKFADCFFPMPYKDPSAVFIQLSEMIGNDAQRLAGIPEMEVGEGRTNTPVGTVMSMVEQSTQNMAAVHKRMHAAQAQELQLLKDQFVDDPEALTKYSRSPSKPDGWTKAALMDADLVPSSDPNIPSQMHRMMLSTALMTVAANNPLYDQRAVHRRAWRQVGVNDIDSLMVPEGQGGTDGIPPEMLQALAEAKQKDAELAFKKEDAQRKAAHEVLEAQQEDKQRSQEAELEQRKMMFEMQRDQVQAQMETANLLLDAKKLAQDAEQQRLDIQTQREQMAHDAKQSEAERKDAEAERKARSADLKVKAKADAVKAKAAATAKKAVAAKPKRKAKK